ncbi:MAG: hypothetical protein ACRDCK_11605, partial [Plesiomonas shigelloides]
PCSIVGIPFRTSPCFWGSAPLFRMHEILAVMWLLVQDSQFAGICRQYSFLSALHMTSSSEGQGMFCSTATL